MNEDIDNNKDYQIMELKQRISYYGPYKQKYEDLKEDWKYIKSLLDKEFNERTRLKKENEQLKFENETLKSNYQREIQSSIDFCNAYSKINGELLEKIEKLEKENEQLKRERDSWKSSTCSYMNKDSVLSMDCQIVQEALWELEKEIEFGSKREDLFFDLKEKFEKLNNHRIGVFE